MLEKHNRSLSETQKESNQWVYCYNIKLPVRLHDIPISKKAITNSMMTIGFDNVVFPSIFQIIVFYCIKETLANFI